jgi:hypothetical protein
VITDVLQWDHLLGIKLQRLYRLRAAVNAVHLQRLDALAKLDGYSGDQSIGVHLNEIATGNEGVDEGIEMPALGGTRGTALGDGYDSFSFMVPSFLLV